MLPQKKTSRGGVEAVLNDPRVRQVIHEGQTLYTAADLVGVLTDSQHPAELWNDLKTRHPAVAERIVRSNHDGEDLLDLESVFRLIQSIESPRAERLKIWLAATARERIEEAQDPELALVRTRRAYEQQGYSRQWIDQRMRSVSARHELTGEWYRRGVRESEEFRALTNAMLQSAFGMDVEVYRRYKGLFRTGQNLRDHMTDLELALMSLGEIAAVELHRQRRSSGFDATLLDAKDTGRIIAGTRAEIERQTGRPVVSALNHLPPRDQGPRPPRRPGAQGRIAPMDAPPTEQAKPVAA